MSHQYTHVIEIYPEKTERVMIAPNRAEDRVHPPKYILSRWDTGLIIGAAEGRTCNLIDFEHEKTVGTTYRDEKFALRRLREYADTDALKTYDQPHAYIEEIDMEKKILQPAIADVTAINRSKQ